MLPANPRPRSCSHRVPSLLVSGLLLALVACGDSNSSSSTATEGDDTSASSSGTTAGPGSSDATDGTSETSGATSSTISSTGEDTSATSGTPGDAEGCDGATLLQNPADTSQRGPWPVGARTVTVDELTVEIWYPAAPGSSGGASPRVYDIRDALPDAEQGKVPDENNAWQPCDCYPDLPIDSANGPYPGVVFVHGTAGFRSQSLEFAVHWASRGFIVMAADHPGLWLKDLLGSLCGVTSPAQDLTGDINALVAAFQTQTQGMAFLAGVADGARIGMAGHSAGGGAIESMGGVAQVLIPMASGGVTPGAALQSTLVLGALSDAVVPYNQTKSAFEGSPAPRRMVGIDNTGHLAFSSLCSLTNDDGQDFLEIAETYDICGAQFASFLFDCEDTYIDDSISWSISQYASAAALESVLHCSSAADNFATIQSAYPEVAEYLEAL